MGVVKDDLNGDWLHGFRWTLIYLDLNGEVQIVKRLRQLLKSLALEAESKAAQKQELRRFLRYRSAIPMPKSLRREVDEFLRS